MAEFWIIKTLSESNLGGWLALLVVLGVVMVFKLKGWGNGKKGNAKPAPGEAAVCVTHTEILHEHGTALAVMNNELHNIKATGEETKNMVIDVGKKLDKVILAFPKRTGD